LGNSSSQIATDSAVQSDGRIVMVGRTSSSGAGIVARFLPNGKLDESFGTGGHLLFDDKNFDSVAVDGSDRIVIAGHAGDRGLVTRLLADGSPDPGFGIGGTTATRFDLSYDAPDQTPPENPRLNAVASLEDGSIFAAGTGRGCADYCEFMLLLRLDAGGEPIKVNGQVDGTDTKDSQQYSALDLLPDGHLVTVERYEDSDGYTSSDYTTVRYFEPPAADGKVRLAWRRTFATGANSPGGGGRVTPAGDGGFYLASGTSIFKGTPAGPDEDFGRNGLAGFSRATFHVGSRSDDILAGDLAVDADGKLLVAGLYARSTRYGRLKSSSSGLLARLDPSGLPDPTFSNNGLRRVGGTYGYDGRSLVLPRVLLTSPDRYVVTRSGTFRTGDVRFALSAFKGGDAPDASCDGRTATWVGTPESDSVRVDSGVIYTGGGDDRIYIDGDSDDTVICAGSGEDRITMHGGTAFAGPGDDRVTGLRKREKKTREYLRSDEEVHGGPGQDLIDGLAGDDRIHGDAGQDSIRGGQGDDDLFGGDGRDEITGEEGNDHLFGGAGNDHLEGGPTIRPRTYYTGKVGRTEIQLVRVNHAFVRIRIKTPIRCDRYSSYSYWSRIEKPVVIGRGGRFGYLDDSYDVESLTGRLKSRQIEGVYQYTISDDYDECWSGKGYNRPWVRFQANFEGTRRQMVRQ